MGRGAAISERLFTFPLDLHCRSNTARCNGKHLVHLHRMTRLTFNSPRINSTVASLNTAFQRLTTWKQCFISFSLLATDRRLARLLKRITESFLSSIFSAFCLRWITHRPPV
ncbi:hypothetical protein T07_1403 [Trichinella nelsoni]|uniref:Uncharacterized protein n=1 Tax=Trichinella nelsoni TaxID=6336 RepID=A0A0V0SBS2_9BILA|nr:hypothetical protein T07_1403 [Trichinella nelsoni]